MHKSFIVGRVKKRPYGPPLLIKLLVRISRKRLSFGIVPLQEMDSLFNASTGLNHSAIIPPTSHMLTRWRFSLLSFRSYLSGFFFPIDVIMLTILTLSKLEPLRQVEFSPRTVAPCTLRHRFGMSLALPSLLF